MDGNRDFNVGINENALDDIMLKLNNDIDSISTLLHDIEMKFYDINEYFSGDVADEIQNKFKTYSNEFDNIKENLSSYVRDLMNVKIMMGKIDTSNMNYFIEKQEEVNKATEEQKAENEINNGEIETPVGY